MRTCWIALAIAPALAACAPTDRPGRVDSAETWMYQIQGLDEDDAVPILAATEYPLLVLEPGHNFADSPYDTPQIVADLRETPSGDERLLIAYIDIGQAEEYRDYWAAGGFIAPPDADNPGDPDFILAADPNNWAENWVVAYWRADWKDLWTGAGGIVEALADLGFDGVYLDWVEAWDDERVWAVAEADGVDVGDEMMAFIEEIGAAGRGVIEDFVVIPQNAPYLIDHDPDRYAAAIDALACEDTWFYGEGDVDWDAPDAGDLQGGNRHDGKWSTASRLAQYEEYTSRDIPVFTVDYVIAQANADQVYEESAAAGLRPLATRVPLSRLTETPPPVFAD